MAIQQGKKNGADTGTPEKVAPTRPATQRNEFTRRLIGTQSRLGANQFAGRSVLNPGEQRQESSDLVFGNDSDLQTVVSRGMGRSDDTENMQTRSLANMKNVPDAGGMASARSRQPSAANFGVVGGLPSKLASEHDARPVRKPV